MAVNTRKRRALLAMGLAGVFVGSLFAGCHKDEPKPTDSGYYDGPMKGKGASGKGAKDSDANAR